MPTIPDSALLAVGAIIAVNFNEKRDEDTNQPMPGTLDSVKVTLFDAAAGAATIIKVRAADWQIIPDAEKVVGTSVAWYAVPRAWAMNGNNGVTFTFAHRADPEMLVRLADSILGSIAAKS